MIKTNFVILLCIHLLGDFYFQTQKMAERKQKQFSWTVYHCLIYAACAWGLFFLFMPGLSLRYIFVFSLAHAVIDMMKYVICRYCSGKYQILSGVLSSRNIFLADQALHLILLMGIASWMGRIEITGLYRTGISAFFDAFEIPEKLLLRWAVVLLIIHKPANILTANVLSGYKPPEKAVADRNAGRMIGTLERIIMVIFIAIGQYSAVGLVLTAKSIARYDRISKDQVFAEYYLLGTLLSTLCAVVTAVTFL